VAAGITALCGWERFADCWKVCCRAGWAGLAGDCDGTAWLGSKVGLETAGSPVARKLSTWVLAPAALKALDALAALLELVAEAPEAPETPEAALPGWRKRRSPLTTSLRGNTIACSTAILKVLKREQAPESTPGSFPSLSG